MGELKVGVMGCGAISDIYLKNLMGVFSDRVRVVAVGDVMAESARKRAGEHGIATFGGPEAVLENPEVGLVLNLTPAPVHYASTKQMLMAGKHVYSEKPLALSMMEGRELVSLAGGKGLMLSVAPDTLLGAGVQTCRRIIDSGEIGKPVSAFGFVSVPSNTERYFTVFRGPLLDLGPYHVGALLMMLGAVKSVSGIAQAKIDVPAAPLPPAARTVENPGQAAAVLEFASGAVATLICTVEYEAYSPELKVWGTKSAVVCNDPNNFGGPVKLAPPYKPLEEQSLRFPHGENRRGIGVWDMAGALAEGRPPRLSAELALHSLEVMLAVIESTKSGRRIELTTVYERSEPMPGLAESEGGSAVVGQAVAATV